MRVDSENTTMCMEANRNNETAVISTCNFVNPESARAAREHGSELSRIIFFPSLGLPDLGDGGARRNILRIKLHLRGNNGVGKVARNGLPNIIHVEDIAHE